MAKKSGLKRIISIGIGAVVAALALLNAYKAIKRATRAMKHATEK